LGGGFVKVLALALVALAVLAAGGCATTPPSRVDDACVIFREKPDWWDAARGAEKRWGTPVQVQLAILRQESSFRHDAKPPRDRLLGLPMWWRVSSAYGYAQAKDSTWDWYREQTGKRWADRDDFDDATDFVGWYTDVSQRTLGISKWDTYNQYLAYHEGHGGWKRRTYARKGWLLQVARRVEHQAGEYGAQLRTCRDELDRPGWPWPFR
jgi:hypothetical protein